MNTSRRVLLSLTGGIVLAGYAGARLASGDPLYSQAVEVVMRSGEYPTVALVQRKLKIGYGRALRLVEDMKGVL